MTCFLAAGNTRTALLYAIRSRHHYATTGCRLNLDVTSNGLAGTSMMGDIVPTAEETVPLRVDMEALAGIESVEVRNGEDVVETVRGYGPEQLGNRIRIT